MISVLYRSQVDRKVLDTTTVGDVIVEHVAIGVSWGRSFRHDVTCPTCVETTGRPSGGAIGEFLDRIEALRAAYEHEHIEVVDGATITAAVA